jgi:hypothetical protein
VLDDLAVADPEDVDLADRVGPAGRRDAQELPDLRRPDGDPDGHAIALRDQVLHREVGVGEDRREPIDGAPQVGLAVNGRAPRVRHEVVGQQLVHRLEAGRARRSRR